MLVQLTRGIVNQYIDEIKKMSAQLHGDYWKAEHYLSDLYKKWELSYAIIENSELIGFMIVSDKGQAHHLHRIVIKENKAGKGYGKMLIDRLVNDAKTNGKSNVTLKVHPTNAVAIQVYEKSGFKKEGVDGENYIYSLKLVG